MMEFDKIEVYVQDFLYLLVLLVYRVIDDVSVLSLDTGAGVRRGIRVVRDKYRYLFAAE